MQTIITVLRQAFPIGIYPCASLDDLESSSEACLALLYINKLVLYHFSLP